MSTTQAPKPLVIYHANCIDGFTAAYVFWCKFHDNAEYLAASYGDEIPNVADREVFIVDFSYPIDKMEQIIKSADSVTWLDHHAPALIAISPLSQVYPSARFLNRSNINKSGAMLAYEFVGGDEFTLGLVEYVQDMDLGKHELVASKAVNAYIASVEFNYRAFWGLEAEIAASLNDFIIPAGEALLRNEDKVVKDLVDNYSYPIYMDGLYCLVCNAPRYLRNAVCDALCKKQMLDLVNSGLEDNKHTVFAATYYIQGFVKTYSLRSLPDGADVNAIANLYGGGGHKHAAGFTVSTAHSFNK